MSCLILNTPHLLLGELTDVRQSGDIGAAALSGGVTNCGPQQTSLHYDHARKVPTLGACFLGLSPEPTSSSLCFCNLGSKNLRTVAGDHFFYFLWVHRFSAAASW